MHIETLFVHGGQAHKSVTGSLVCPIYQTATFEHPELGKSTGFDYSRTQNPTRQKTRKFFTPLIRVRSGWALAFNRYGGYRSDF